MLATNDSASLRSDDSRAGFREFFREKAFALTDERPVLFSPLLGKHAVYVIARQSKLPRELQPLGTRRDRKSAGIR